VGVSIFVSTDNSSPPENPFANRMDIDSEPQTRHVLYWEHDADVDVLLEYRGFRYHLLLRETDTVSTENRTLAMLHDALDREDNEALDRITMEWLNSIWPLIAADCTERIRNGECETANDKGETANDKGETVHYTIKLQAMTKDGVQYLEPHDKYLQYPPTAAIPNEYNITTVAETKIEKLDRIDGDIFKVRLGDGIYCLKGVHQTLADVNFKREIRTLQQCSHPNIIRLLSLVVNAEDMVEGMLLAYVPDSRSLVNVNSLSKQQFDAWTTQLRDALGYLHERNLTWGDAKADNVLIREDDSLVLIDFGGGRTEGWVDKENYETVQGDWQGFDRILCFLSKKLNEQEADCVVGNRWGGELGENDCRID